MQQRDAEWVEELDPQLLLSSGTERKVGKVDLERVDL
jgi:hypothetical protein